MSKRTPPSRPERTAQRRSERAARKQLALRWAAQLRKDGWTRTLSIDDMAALLNVSHDVIRKRLKDGTFPIAPIGIAHAYGWWGPTVKKWLDARHGLPKMPRRPVSKVRRRRTEGAA